MPKMSRLAEEVAYEHAARAYERTLIPEKHLMESTAQARQREITVESLALVRAKRPEVHYYNELLVQYQLGRERKIHGVVPDNMVVLSHEPLDVLGSYIIKHQPVKPYWMFEYVSKSNERKDYERNFTRYEQELKIPYYLLFYPDHQELSLFRLREGRYNAVTPNKRERLAIPTLDLEMALLDGWVRYWYQGELLLLPAELDRARQTAEAQAAVASAQAVAAAQRATAAEQQAAQDRQALQDMQAELARLRAQLGQ